jgi:REP element-mobilizing transposase RayT
MAHTVGYHLVKSCYGVWLPGDERGSWSEAWDPQIGFHQPHTLHPENPQRRAMAQRRMRHRQTRLDEQMIRTIAQTMAELVRRSQGGLSIAAMAIEPTHMHLLIRPTGRDIETTAKWIADQTTKAVRRRTGHAGPVWSKGRWLGFVFDESGWEATRRYIERHNERRGLGPRPYAFIQ